MTPAITYRSMPLAAGMLHAARMTRVWRAALAETVRERSSVSTWEAEGGSLAMEAAPHAWRGNPPRA